MYKFIALFLVTAVASVNVAGPSQPVEGYSGGCTEEGMLFADEKNLCWYHQCIVDADGYLTLLPRLCALGSKLDYTFETGKHNPCTVNMDGPFGYECDRNGVPAADVPPACASDGSLKCYHGGTLTYEASSCWCLCTLDWQGEFDCSKKTGYGPIIIDPNAICHGGEPDRDYCSENGGCHNDGVCHNQCRGFWCDCPNRGSYDYKGNRCQLDTGEYKK